MSCLFGPLVLLASWLRHSLRDYETFLCTPEAGPQTGY